jgi:hypothetical protein
MNASLIRPTIPTAAALTRRREHAQAEAARVGNIVHGSAEELAKLLDREDGDWGENADAIRAYLPRIENIRIELRAMLGEPRVRFAGGLVPASMLGGSR